MIQQEENAKDSLLFIGNQYFDKENYEQAILEYIKVMQLTQQKYQYFCERGKYFADLGKQQSAIHNFIQQYNYLTQLDLAQYLRGMASYYQNKYQDALADYTQILQRCQGNAHRQLQQFEQANSDYSEAIKLDEDYAVAYQNRGIVLNDLGRKNDALIDYSKAIAIDSLDAICYYNRGVEFDELGRYEDAINDYSMAIGINSEYADAYNNRGISKNELGRNEDAIIDYTKVIEINSQYAAAYVNRGRIISNLKGNALNQLGRTDDAYNDYLNAQYIQSQVPSINNKLGKQILNDKQKIKTKEEISYELVNNKFQTLTMEKLKLVQKNKPIEVKDQINQTIEEDYQNEINSNLKKLLKRQNDHSVIVKKLQQDNIILKQDNIKLNIDIQEWNSQNSQIIKKEIIELKQDQNRFIYYLSLYWRLSNFIQACQQLSTDLLLKNPDGVTFTKNTKAAQMISKVAQQISNVSGTIPIIGTVIMLISSALEYVFSNYKDYQFDQIVRKITQIVELRSCCRNEIDEEIQLAIIQQSKILPKITNDQQLEGQGLLYYVQQIWQNENDSEKNEAYNQYWKQGIVDTFKILQNLLINHDKIQQNKSKRLHDVIYDQLQGSNRQSVRGNVRYSICDHLCEICERCRNNCQIL